MYVARQMNLRNASLVLLIALWACAGSVSETDAAGFEPEPFAAPAPRSDLTTGDLLVETERHLRAWEQAMAAQRSERNREAIEFTERAIAIFVRREQTRLETQAVSGPPRNRALASAALGFSGDDKVLPLIQNNVGDPNPMVSSNALLGLGVLASAETAIGPVYEVLQRSDVAEEVVRNATFAAYRLANTLRSDPDGNLAAIFLPLLSHPDARIRAQAASGLGLIEAGHAVPRLNELVTRDPASTVRTAAAFALGEIGSSGSTAVLILALDDVDRLTAGTARGSLAKIHGQDLGPDSGSWQPLLERN